MRLRRNGGSVLALNQGVRKAIKEEFTMRIQGGWRAFAEWALAVALLSFAVLAAASIGMLLLPFALLALALAARRNRAWPEARLGGLTGIGSVCLYMAYISRAYSPCPAQPTRIRVFEGDHVNRYSCGGFEPMPWLAAGLLLTAAGCVGYLISRRTRLDGGAT